MIISFSKYWNIRTAILVVIFVFQFLSGFSQKQFHFEFASGMSYVPPLPLTVSQEGYERIQLWARYKTASFKLPLYYSVRLGWSQNNKGWEAEMNHLKVYLKNNPETIERFSISHGYNQIFVNRVRHYSSFSGRTGAGVVIAHPENTIREKQLDENRGIFGNGYYLAGPAFLIGLFRKAEIGPHFYVSFSGSVTAAWAWVKVSDGHASVPVCAFQIQIAPGLEIHQKEHKNKNN